MQPSRSTGIWGVEDTLPIQGHISCADTKGEAVSDRLHTLSGSPGGPSAFRLLDVMVAAMCQIDKCCCEDLACAQIMSTSPTVQRRQNESRATGIRFHPYVL
jgi:hypothetical protein